MSLHICMLVTHIKYKYIATNKSAVTVAVMTVQIVIIMSIYGDLALWSCVLVV